MIRKKIMGSIVCLAVSMCFVACGNQNTGDSTSQTTGQTKEAAQTSTQNEASTWESAQNTQDTSAESVEDTTQATTQDTSEEKESAAEAAGEDASLITEGENMDSKYEIEILCPNEYREKQKGNKYPELIHTSYYSTTCEKNRNVNIQLPADYDAEKQYPVLYVLHGIFGDENTMIGNSVTIANMMSDQTAEEMIVVYPYMYASKTKDACTAIDNENVAAYDNFVNDLVTDLMPYMKDNYSVKEGKENTAIAGFSMGGRESLAIGLQRPDLFGYVGAIAPAPGLVPGRDWAMQHPGQFKEEEVTFTDEKPYFIFLCCGDSDKTVGTFPKTYHELFEKNGVEHTWWEIPGSDHGDPAISSGIYNFCRYIFR